MIRKRGEVAGRFVEVADPLRPTMAELNRAPVRANVTLIDTALFGKQWECETGQTAEPVGCQRHSTHHYCGTCEGWYGVPHTGMHTGRNPHPHTSWGQYCACRPCVQWREANPRG